MLSVNITFETNEGKKLLFLLKLPVFNIKIHWIEQISSQFLCKKYVIDIEISWILAKIHQIHINRWELDIIGG